MKKIICGAMFLLIGVTSCQYDNQNGVADVYSNEKIEENNYKSDENPFSVQIMLKALDNLKSEKKIDLEDFPGFSIKTTHLYVRLMPKDADDEGLIKSDSTVFVFDHPLHLSEQEEEAYLSNRKPLSSDQDEVQSAFSNYYASIPVDEEKKLNGKYEVIDNLYIPEEDPYFEKVDQDGDINQAIKTDADLLANLLYYAYKLTGRESELEDDIDGDKKGNNASSNLGNIQSIWVFGSKWNPSGNLKIWDSTIKGYIPLKGAQVLMRQGFTVRQGITDQNGYFRTGSVRGKAKYLLQWERHNYSIRTNTFFQASTSGPRVKKQAWNLNIKGGSDQYYGTIHHAAWMYYYTPRFGFASPPQNGFLKRQIKIAARKKSGTSSHMNARGLYGGSQVSILEWGKESDVVFGTTIHELTHASHFQFDRSSYNNLVKKAYIPPFSSAKDGAKRLLETWATTAEIFLTNHWYQIVLGESNYKFRYNDFQQRLIYDPKHSDTNYYTSAGIDMMDYFNQRDHYHAGYPMDRVSGYTPAQLQYSLRGATSWNGWKDRIKSQHVNSTSVYLDELFANW